MWGRATVPLKEIEGCQIINNNNINLIENQIDDKNLKLNCNINSSFQKRNKKIFETKKSSLINIHPPTIKESIISYLNKQESKLEKSEDKINKEIIITNNDININKEDKNNDNDKINNLKFNDYELNEMPYKNALINDNRTFFNYYFSLLKRKHLLLFSFCENNDYNSMIIKILLFFFSFALFYTINALFYNDSTMHKIYEDNGIFNFVYHLNQIFYSLIISIVITSIIKYLSLTEKNLLKIKNEDNKNLDNILKNELNCLKKKFVLFFILSFIFLLFFWYYLGCFGAVYKNTQIHLIKDTLISFGFSLIYPLILNLLPGILRIPSLKNKNRKCLYNISKIVQIM